MRLIRPVTMAVLAVCVASFPAAAGTSAKKHKVTKPPIEHCYPGKMIGNGTASWYGAELHGEKSADGSHFDMLAMTAAHRSLPFGTKVRVRNRQNGRVVVVKITDRGPYIDGRVIDLSREAARELGYTANGTAPVELKRCVSKAAFDAEKLRQEKEAQMKKLKAKAKAHHKKKK